MLGIAVIVFATLVADTAYSDNPTPSGGKETNPPQKQTKNSNKPPEKDERGAEKSPLIIKMVDAPKSEPSSTKTESLNKQNTPDWWMTHEWSMVWLTIGLIIVGGMQLFMFFKQLKLIKERIKPAETAANAALETAKSITASERAYVFVNIKIVENIVATPSGNASSWFTVNFCNHGKTPAIITRLRGDIELIEAMPQSLPATLGIEERLQEGLVIASEKVFTLTLARGISNSEIGEIVEASKTLICYGHIEYKDILGNVRETGYCWAFRPDQNRFAFCGNSRLNHYT